MALYKELIVASIMQGMYKTPDNVQRWMNEHKDKLPVGYYLTANSALRCIQVWNDQGEKMFSIDYESIEHANNYYIMETLRHISNR